MSHDVSLGWRGRQPHSRCVVCNEAQPPVMFALYETHEKDVYEKMLAVEQSLMRSGVNVILQDKRKTQSELNKDLERLKSKKGVLLHVASAGFAENTDLESCHELKYALDNNIETLCLKTEEQYSPEHRKDTKKGESAGPVENMLAAAESLIKLVIILHPFLCKCHFLASKS